MRTYKPVDTAFSNSLPVGISETNQIGSSLAGSNILILNDHLPYTGIGKSTFQTFNRMREAGADVDMLLAHQDEEYNSDAVITQKRPRFLRGIKKHGLLFELLSYFYFPNNAPDGYSLYHVSSQMLARYCNFVEPSVVTCCDSIAFRVDGNHDGVSQYLLRKHFDDIGKAKRVIFVSEHARNDFLNLFDYDPDRTVVIYNGIDRETFTPGDKYQEREKLGLPQDAPIILNVGSENPRKNMPTLMKSLEILRRNVPEARLLRVGKMTDETGRVIDDLGISGSVDYRSNVSESELVSCYRAADVFMFPSYYEGFGMPVLEAFAAELPVVSSSATSLSEVAGDAALLSEPFDADSMAIDVERVLSDSELRQTLVKKGNDRVSRFSWDKAARETMKLYCDVLGD